jgi:protein-S-isoprenylcysteine O-methyltransferase Ste14
MHMFDRDAVAVFLDKVPDLRSPRKLGLTLLYVLLLALVCAVFFYYVDRLWRYGPLVSQLVMALVVAVIGYVHFARSGAYRAKHGPLAYRYHFYHLIVPYLVTWYACFFHPLFVAGPALLPPWLAILLGVLFLVLFGLTSLHIERAGFQMITHGMDVYTVFPEEATIVHGEIYGFVRHPLYLALVCGSIGLAFFRNSGLALLVSLLQLIPALAVGYLEDRELIERAGEAHREYIGRTPALVPWRRLGAFLKFLVSLGPS